MKKRIIILFTGVAMTMLSCNDDFLDITNPNAFDANTYFIDSTTCQRSVNSIYTIMLHKGMFSRDWYFNFDLLANEAGPLTPLQGQIAELPRGVYDASNSALSSTWDRLYRMVLRANYAIDVNTKWAAVTERENYLRERNIAEARFFLGFAYYHLGSLWGAVPLRKSFDETSV